MADEFKKKLGSGVVALIGIEDGKASAVVGVTDDSPAASARSIWCKPASRRWAARAAAAGPTWRRAAARMRPRRPRRCRRSRRLGRGQVRITPLLAAAALAAAALTSACAPKTFSMEGKDADQMTKDESQCRAQVREVAQRNRNIEDQRRSVFEGERERFGQQDLYTTMDNQGYNNNVDRLMARCMEARGWAPEQQNGLASWWQRVSRGNTPVGKSLGISHL